MCPRRLLPFSVTRGLEYSTETVAGPICWVTVARWLSPLGGRDSPSARATLENNAHVQRKVLFIASGTTPYASPQINARNPNGADGRQNRRDRVEPARTGPPGGRPTLSASGSTSGLAQLRADTAARRQVGRFTAARAVVASRVMQPRCNHATNIQNSAEKKFAISMELTGIEPVTS